MGTKRKESYTKGFRYGRYEHRLERWTNISLTITIILFITAIYFHCFFLMYFVFGWLMISFVIHLLARACHGTEKKWHTKARNEKKGFFR